MGNKRTAGGRIFGGFLLVFLFYCGYLAYLYFRLPFIKREIGDIYMAAMSRNAGDINAGAPQKQGAGAVIQINERTSDAELGALQKDPKVIKKAQSYEKLLDSKTIAVLNNILKLIPGAARQQAGADQKDELKAALEILKENNNAVNNAAQEKN
ncbi:MAG: hypothetical protein ABSA34_04800 [Candidatus Goldiibacteriota bacterium]